jgi:protein archease
MMTEKYWEHFAHGADIGVRGVGTSKEEAFEQAALALVAVVTDPQKVAPEDAVEISCEALDAELLLADWLNELVYEMATRKILFGRFEVRIDGHRLRATAWGERVNVARHQPAVEVKGATYTNLLVKQDSAGAWVAQCVVDV